jgi:hypothetical protein
MGMPFAVVAGTKLQELLETNYKPSLGIATFTNTQAGALTRK